LEVNKSSKLSIALKFICFSLLLFKGIIEEDKGDDGGEYSNVSVSIILSLLLSYKEDNGIEEEEEVKKTKIIIIRKFRIMFFKKFY
jgi:hypothetical protein